MPIWVLHSRRPEPVVEQYYTKTNVGVGPQTAILIHTQEQHTRHSMELEVDFGDCVIFILNPF